MSITLAIGGGGLWSDPGFLGSLVSAGATLVGFAFTIWQIRAARAQYVDDAAWDRASLTREALQSFLDNE